MNTPSPEIAPLAARRPTHWPTILHFGLSAFAIVNLWSLAAVLAVLGLVGLTAPTAFGIYDPVPLFMMAASMLISGLLVLPSAWYALLRLIDRRATQHASLLLRFHPGWWILAFPFVLLAGFGASKVHAATWLLLPPFHVLGVLLPVGWLVYLAVRNLPLGSPQRLWGVFSAGLVLGPMLIIVAELVAGVVFVLLVALVLSTQPQAIQQISRLSQWLLNQDPDPTRLLEAIQPYITNPWVIGGVLSFVAVIVPLVEELFKPIGVWLLFRRLSPGAGFVAGALSGAGYALFESLALASGGQEWVALIVARIGTSAVHILTTALTGWGLAWAWSKGHYGKLAVAYLGAVGLHSLWNTLAVLSAFNMMPGDLSVDLQIPASYQLAGSVATILLGTLAVLTVGAIFMLNRRLVQRGRQRLSPIQQEAEPESVL